jgi:ATP-dependent DNA helicase DinG
MAKELGQWAVIDIETTGIDPLYDDIIDVGFLQFEGSQLVNRYSSLVRSSQVPSYFIQKLTGISESMVRKAPIWSDVEPEVSELFGHHLIAHNADFERSFLEQHFDKIDDGAKRESYEDSIPFLALLFPNRSSLKLENFIVDWKIAEGEQHRGLADSIDLLKVLLVAIRLVKEDRELFNTVSSLFHKYDLKSYWYYHLFNCFDDQLVELSEAIDFDLDEALEKAREFEDSQKEHVEFVAGESPFSYEFSGNNIKDIFRAEDSIKETMPGYRYRKAQEDLSLRAGQSFTNGVHALVQAPTGTGKTMGYLVPSALFSMQEKKQVLIATGTKTLQHQAMKKDVPLLRELLGLDQEKLKVKRLVGSSNHMCELLFRQSIDEEDLLFSSRTFEDKFADMFFELAFFHNSRFDNDQWILRDNLPFVFKRKFEAFKEREKTLAVDFRSCTGNSCPFKTDCTYIRGLREAKEADIIVGNHALTFSWPRAFPRPEYIVIDEAHKIEEETTRAFSLEASQEALEGLARSLNHMQGIGSLFYLLAAKEESSGESTPIINALREKTQETHQMMMDHLRMLPDIFEQYFKKHPRYTEYFWNELPMIGKDSQVDSVGTALFNHLESLKYILKNYSQALMPYISLYEVKNLEGEQEIIALTRFETFASSLDDIVVALETSLEKKDGHSHSLKFHEKEGYCVFSGPVNIGETLYNHLLQTSKSVFFTSATLGNALGDQGFRGVEWVTGYGYLEPERRFKHGFFLPAPYDYKNKTKVFLCDDVPKLHETGFVEAILKKINPLIREIEGKTLLLFSARKRFEVAREVLLKEFDGEIPVFVQGMGPSVVDEFKKHGSGILLGMESFGEGIDIPGDALQFVFIDKIPDLRMDKIINDRRDFYETNIGNEFTDYYLSHRTRSLHQKLGRLLRTENDRGGVIVVDSRIKRWKGATMQKFNKLMEPYHINRTNLDEAIVEVSDFILNQGESDSNPYQDHSSI